MSRLEKLYIGTNLKMYKTIAQTVEYLQRLKALTVGIEGIELFVIPSYTSLESAKKSISGSHIRLGAQNMCWEDEGQFTGEISPLMLKEVGVDIIEIGHSERRHVFGEDNEEINKKVRAAINHGFTALMCIGETGEQKALGLSDENLSIQLKAGLSGINKEDIGRLWIAYEPVWAIGVNGIPASAEYANEKQSVIKSVLGSLYGDEGYDIPVLYGGSVNPGNALEMITQPCIDGLFIGRSAWSADSFDSIIRQVLPLFQNKRQPAGAECNK
jgi:triosephosphate isomerase